MGQSLTLNQPLVACRHCGTPSNSEFCCSGCAVVFRLIQDSGLGRFYDLRDQNPPVCTLPATVSTESYAFCDDPEMIKRFARNEREMDFFIEGLNCSACLWLLEKLPSLSKDVESATVNFATSIVHVRIVPGGSFAKSAEALNRLGHHPHLTDASTHTATLRQNEKRRDLVRIGVAAAVTGNIMIFSVSLYGGANGGLGHAFEWLTALIALPSLTYCAYPFYKSAYHAVRNRSLNLDVPIVAALLAGIIMSAWNLARGNGAIYFDSLTMLVFLLLSSRVWLKSMQQHHLDVSHLENQLLLGSVRRLRDDQTVETVSNLSLKKDDLVVIEGPGLIPADGLLHRGQGQIHAAALTGESEPIRVSEGAQVFAGTQNLEGSWILKVTQAPGESRLARILREADTASKSKPEFLQFADRVGRYFVAVVFVLAIAVVAWFFKTNAVEGFTRALALVIVTCPCVFGMAIPLSLSLAVKAAAQRGLIIKNGDVIERLAHVRKIFFDKTGTLTEGHLELVNVEILTNEPNELAAINALERDQDHPVARALIKSVQDLRLPEVYATKVNVSTAGLTGEINGVQYSITSEASNEAGIRSRYILKKNSEILARFEFGDRLRNDAKETVQKLQNRGFEVTLLSGDRREVVDAVSKQLGLEQALASVSPEEKSRLLKSCGVEAVMVGDGANDAAALGSASVGIAVQGSMETSLKAADIYLLKPNLDSIVELFSICDRTRRAIYRNLVFSASFNIFAGALALTGHMEPLWAAVFMPLSSFTVLMSALITGRTLGGSK